MLVPPICWNAASGPSGRYNECRSEYPSHVKNSNGRKNVKIPYPAITPPTTRMTFQTLCTNSSLHDTLRRIKNKHNGNNVYLNPKTKFELGIISPNPTNPNTSQSKISVEN